MIAVRHRKGGQPTEAVQWFADVQAEGIVRSPVTIQYSADKSRYRIKGDGVEPKLWVDVDGTGSISAEFWDVAAGQSFPIDIDHPLYLKAKKAEGWRDDARTYGVLPSGDRVHEGEWLVKTVLGAWTVYSADDFKKEFEVEP